MPARLDVSANWSVGMTKVLVLLSATIGSAVGWWLGAFLGMMSAFFLSVVGMAAGVYVARRLAAEYGY